MPIGYQQGADFGANIGTGITNAWKQYEEDKKQALYNEQMFDYLRTIPGAVPEDKLAKWHKMNPKEKNATILAAQFRASQDALRTKAAQEARTADLQNRRTIAETNTAIIKTAKEAAEPVFTGPKETTTASGTKLVQTGPTSWQVQKGNEPPLNLTEQERKDYEKTGAVPLRTSEKSFVPGKLPAGEDVDMDDQGRPLVDWERGTFKSGGKIKPITQAMLKSRTDTLEGRAQLATTQADLEKEKARKANVFGFGKPDEKKIAQLEAQHTRLMSLWGTPAAAPNDMAAPSTTPAPAPEATATPTPAPVAAAPTATPAPSAAPPAAGPPPAGRITVVAPDGTVGTIPPDQLPIAIQQGYTQQ